MHRHAMGVCLAMLLLGGTGCAKLPAALPSIDEVTEIRITVRQPAPDGGPNVPCDVTLTDRSEIASVMGWLAEIDWSQQGTDLTSATVPQADGGISITTKGKAA